VPLIGDGGNHFQMISVFDCVSAIEAALDEDVPNETLNLGSLDPPTVRELLERVIATAGSRSHLVPVPARPVKAILTALDALGLSPLYLEQFQIADENYLVDVSRTVTRLGWRPRYDDVDMLAAVFCLACAMQEFGDVLAAQRSSSTRGSAAPCGGSSTRMRTTAGAGDGRGQTGRRHPQAGRSGASGSSGSSGRDTPARRR